MPQELDVDELECNWRRRLVIRARDGELAYAVLIGAGFSAKLIPNDIIEVKDEATIERPDDIATRLVKARHAPTMINVEQEDLEHCQAIWVGLLKARRSKRPLLTALGFSLAPLAGGFFMIVLKFPVHLFRCWQPHAH